MSQLPYMDLTFNLIDETLAFDHGCKLFSAIAHFEPELHKLDTVGIHTIAGIPKSGVIQLTKNSRLRIRLPVDEVRLVYPLAGKPLRIGKYTIPLGIPEIYLLEPAEKRCENGQSLTSKYSALSVKKQIRSLLFTLDVAKVHIPLVARSFS